MHRPFIGKNKAMTQETELKPCPFCGAEAKKMPMKDSRLAIGCSKNCNMLAELTDNAAMETWNTRAIDPTKAKLIEALESVLFCENGVYWVTKNDDLLHKAKEALEKAKAEV